MNQQAIMQRMNQISEARASEGQTVQFKMPTDEKWQTASFATSERAEYFKARVNHQGGEIA